MTVTMKEFPLHPSLIRTDIEGWMTPEELAWLSAAAIDRTVLEIGAWKGRSTRALASGARRIVTIDHFKGDGTPAHAQAARDPDSVCKEFLANTADLTNRTTVRGDINAQEPLRFREICNRSEFFEMVFIDGTHTEVQVRHDIAFALAVMTHGCLLAGHDYEPNWPDVVKVVDELFPDAKMGAGTLWYVLL